MKKEKGIIYFLFCTLYKKGKLRCLFDKTTSQVLKRQAQQIPWNSKNINI